jgi:hypothetical protein
MIACAAGCQQDITPPPTEFMAWGDPQSDETSGLVSDIADRGFRIALDGRIQNSGGAFCEETCNVTTNGDVFLEGVLRAEIRWGNTTGPDDIPGTDDDGRRPFFVSTDGFVMNVEDAASGFVFTRSEVEFDPEGVAGNDKAVFIGFITDETDPENPDSGSGNPLDLCGALGAESMIVLVPGLTMLWFARRSSRSRRWTPGAG